MLQYSQENQIINREQKDRLFKIIFGRQENREWTLSLYNAINGTSYDNPEDIEITTIENAVYMGMANDVSFLISDMMNLYEHQSTYNPNMPIRMLIYAGQLYSKYAADGRHDINLYSNIQQKLPVPKLVCFYNGDKMQEDKTILTLKDAFDKPEDSDLDAQVTMLNINYGHNARLMESCIVLRDYAEYIENWRKLFRKTGSKEAAAGAAIEMLSDESPIKPFMLKHKAEVIMSVITEYDEARTMELFRKEAHAEGRAEGRAELLRELVEKGILSQEKAEELLKP